VTVQVVILRNDGLSMPWSSKNNGIDPSTPLRDRDVDQLGSGLWNRVLFDCTRNWKFERQKQWDNERFPPTVRHAPEDEALVARRWREYGLGDI